MNYRDLLNKNMYPLPYDNIVRNDKNKYDLQAIAAGTTEYFFFVTAPGNIFQRNTRLPLSGTEVFFANEIELFLDTTLATPALIDAFNEGLQQSVLMITIDGVRYPAYPGLDFLRSVATFNEDATPEILREKIVGKTRKLPIPLFLNSTSSFEFRFLTTAAFATAFDTINMRLILKGIQLDKLVPGTYDPMKGQEFQERAVTYFDTQVITGAAADTYQFFQNAARTPNLFSQTFPLSDIQKFECQDIEVFVNQPDVPVVPNTIYRNRLQNVLSITQNDRIFYDTNLQGMLSMFAGFAGNITDSAAATTAYNMFTEIRESKILKVPLGFPAQAKVNGITIQQPAGSIGITGEITVAMRGIEYRVRT